jgi:hypothetical protein
MAIPDHVVTFDHAENTDLDIGWHGHIPVVCAQLGVVIPKWRDLHHPKSDKLRAEYSFDIIFHPHVIDTLIKYAILGEKKSVYGKLNEKRCNGIYLVIEYFQEEHTVSCL